MLTSISYVLPDNDAGKETLAILRLLLRGTSWPTIRTPKERSTITLAPPRGLFPITIFCLSSKGQVGIELRSHNGRTLDFPASFFTNASNGTSSLTFQEAAQRLSTHIQGVDHTGLCVSPAVTESDWQRVVDEVASSSEVFDYPDLTDGYNRANARWLFVIPTIPSKREGTHDLSYPRPKFELVFDNELAHLPYKST